MVSRKNRHGHGRAGRAAYYGLAMTYAHEILYPYCDPSALDIDYQQCLIVHELLGYNADILCLQEVDLKTFQRFMLPAMKDKDITSRSLAW